jgi:hypothetical protein
MRLNSHFGLSKKKMVDFWDSPFFACYGSCEEVWIKLAGQEGAILMAVGGR